MSSMVDAAVHPALAPQIPPPRHTQSNGRGLIALIVTVLACNDMDATVLRDVVVRDPREDGVSSTPGASPLSIPSAGANTGTSPRIDSSPAPESASSPESDGAASSPVELDHAAGEEVVPAPPHPNDASSPVVGADPSPAEDADGTPVDASAPSAEVDPAPGAGDDAPSNQPGDLPDGGSVVPSDDTNDGHRGLDSIRRGVASSRFPSELELSGQSWYLADVFPGAFFDVATSLTEAPGTQHLFVTQQNGLILAVDKTAPASPMKVVLDLTATTQGGSDCGLLGLAFHPQFAQLGSPHRGFIYIHRAFSEAPVQPQGAPVEPFTRTTSRLSRFTVDLDTLVADPMSEQILIEQEDESLYHQGGSLFFHPRDGFLYLTVGDEGWYDCWFANCQRIDKDLFSGVLRIDVDERGGNVSHPIPRQPESGTTANYYIPNDNPFVGQPGVLEEFYALGLRSPHRMTHDPVDDLVLIGDVGQFLREEVNLLSAGANFQWNVREGTAAGLGAAPSQPIGVWTDPVLELERAESASLIGGYVYRGDRFPELWGKYIAGDFATGNIWAVTYDYDGAQLVVLERELLLQAPPGLASFGVDSDGELYLLYFGIHPIRKLERFVGQDSLPSNLTDLGLFAAPGKPAHPDVLLPYAVQSPLWSDGAQKDRWVSFPSEGHVSFSTNGAWGFPEGTVFVKHFSMALDERYPSERRPLETRFLVHGASGGYYGVTYKWNRDGTRADLLRERREERLTIVQADGSVRQQRYTYPSPADCLVCHNREAGYVLGAHTAQLNGEMNYPATGRRSNQVLTWAGLGLFGESLTADLDVHGLSALPQLAPLDDETRSLEDRVRSYWDANCSMCHGVNSQIRASWDARYTTQLEDQGVLWGATFSGAGDEAAIWPGDPLRSALFSRSNTTDPNQKMPPLGRNRIDARYVELMGRWIESLGE